MERDAFRTGRKLVVGSIALALATVTALAPSAFSADRVVLMEQFTATWCGPCNLAAPIIGNLIDTYGANGTDPTRAGTFAVVEYHVSDPPWSKPWGESRADFYNVSGIPSFWYDGIINLVGYPGQYAAAYSARLAVPTPVTMSLNVAETATREYTLTMETCLEPNAAAVDLTIYAVLMEDHYPVGEAVSRNTFRAAAATSQISLAPGECEVVVRQFQNVIPMTVEENLKFAAWAQVPLPVNPPAPVYQAAIVAYPFAPPCPWDCGDGDGQVGVVDFLRLLADWGGGSPCDFDGGGVTDVSDFLEMLANWGPCPE